MSKASMCVAVCALASILISAVLCAAGEVSADTNRALIFAGTIAWFVAAPMWLRKNSGETSSN